MNVLDLGLVVRHHKIIWLRPIAWIPFTRTQIRLYDMIILAMDWMSFFIFQLKHAILLLRSSALTFGLRLFFASSDFH